MADEIKFTKGLKVDLPNLLLAEPGFVTDEKRLYIGGLTGNIPLPNKEDIDMINSSLSDLTNKKIDKTSIVNNSTTTQEGFVLDARQGKIINDNLNTLSSKAFIHRGDVLSNADFNSYKTTGFYGYGAASEFTNPPDSGYGILEVIFTTGGFGVQRATNVIDGVIKVRAYDGSTWTSWKTTTQS